MNAIDYASEAGNLFVLPDAVTRIRELREDETASIDDVADVINFDPGLATQLLKVANSALYNFESRVDTISKAIQVIGTDSVFNLALAYGVANAFKDVERDVIDLDRYWEMSVCSALVSKQLGLRLGVYNVEQLFVTGLLHNIGELVVVQVSPDIAKRCVKLDREVTPLKLQKHYLGFPYSDIASELLQAWSIPENIYLPIEHQHASEYTAQTVEDGISQLSRLMALDNVYQDIYPAKPHLKPELYESMELERADVEYALDFANLQSMSVLALFNPSTFSIY